MRNAVPLGLFVGCILILPALGIALVKPCVVGTTARASKENVRSIGYSIYYTMVNIGGALGPISPRGLIATSVSRTFTAWLRSASSPCFSWSSSSSANRARRATRLRHRSRRSRGTSASWCGNYRLVLPVLLVALLLRIGLLIYPRYTAPWWIWVVLLALVLAGISRFMWFLVLFTGYWVVFWQQYISLPGYIHGYINSTPTSKSSWSPMA